MPPPKSFEDQKQPTKYPYVASELFLCEVQSMLDVLFEHDYLLKLLFSFLDQKAPLEPGCASYFRKVVGVCIPRKFDELRQFINENHIIEKLVAHMNLTAVSEILCLLGWEEQPIGVTNVTSEWLYNERLVPLLVSRLDVTFERQSQVHCNASRCLVSLLTTLGGDSSNNNASQAQNGGGGGPSGNKLVSHAKSPPILDKLFRHLLSGSPSCTKHVLPVVTELVSQYAHKLLAERAQGGDDLLELPVMDPVLEKVANALPVLVGYLTDPPDSAPITLQDRHDTERFGEIRMGLLRLCSILLTCECEQITGQLSELGFFRIILDLFFKFRNNNMCHGLVEKVIKYVVESKHSALKTELFIEAKLPSRLIESYEFNQTFLEDPKNNRLGYMGHVFRLCASISSRLKDPTDEVVTLSLVDPEVWTTLEQGYLAAESKIRGHVLGGRRPQGAFGEQMWEQEQDRGFSVYSGGIDDEDSDDDVEDQGDDNGQFRYGGQGGDNRGGQFGQHLLHNWYNDDDSDSDDDDDAYMRGGVGGHKANNSVPNVYEASSSDSSDEGEFQPFGSKPVSGDPSVASMGSSDSSDSSDSDDAVIMSGPASSIGISTVTSTNNPNNSNMMDPFGNGGDNDIDPFSINNNTSDPFAINNNEPDPFANPNDPGTGSVSVLAEPAVANNSSSAVDEVAAMGNGTFDDFNPSFDDDSD